PRPGALPLPLGLVPAARGRLDPPVGPGGRHSRPLRARLPPAHGPPPARAPAPAPGRLALPGAAVTGLAAVALPLALMAIGGRLTKRLAPGEAGENRGRGERAALALLA